MATAMATASTARRRRSVPPGQPAPPAGVDHHDRAAACRVRPGRAGRPAWSCPRDRSRGPAPAPGEQPAPPPGGGSSAGVGRLRPERVVDRRTSAAIQVDLPLEHRHVCRPRVAAAPRPGSVEAARPYARTTLHRPMKSTPGPYCGGNLAGAPRCRRRARFARTGQPFAPSSSSGRVSSTWKIGKACVTVKETSTSSGWRASGRRPATASGARTSRDRAVQRRAERRGRRLEHGIGGDRRRRDDLRSRAIAAAGTLEYAAPTLEPVPVLTLTRSSGARLQATSAG